MLEVRYPTQVLTLGTFPMASASETAWLLVATHCSLSNLSLHSVRVCSLLLGKCKLPLYSEQSQEVHKELLLPLGLELVP